jgi:hypothetical protein
MPPVPLNMNPSCLGRLQIISGSGAARWVTWDFPFFARVAGSVHSVASAFNSAHAFASTSPTRAACPAGPFRCHAA